MSLSSDSGIALPRGWSVAGYREAAQSNGFNRVVQGVVFMLNGPGGGTTSLFVPNTDLGNPVVVAEALTNRINQIQTIVNLPAQ